MNKFLRETYGKSFEIRVVLLALLAFVSAGSQFFTTYFLGRIIDVTAEGYGKTMSYFCLIVYFLILFICSSALFTCLGSQMTAKLSSRLKTKIGEKLCCAAYQDIEKESDSELFTIATKDIEGIKNWVDTLLKTGYLPAQLGLVIVSLLQYQWKFSVITLCLIPLAALPEIWLAKNMHVFHRNEKEAYAKSLSLFSETLERFMVIKSFTLEKLLQKQNRDKLKIYKREKTTRILREQLVDIYGRCYGRIINPMLLILGAYFILKGNMSLGMLTSVILLAGFVGEGLKLICEIPLRYQAGKLSMVRIQRLLCMPNEQEVQVNPQISNMTHDIIFDVRSLHFAYDSQPVLRNVNFQVRRGEKIAILGESGCGKTTLFKLLSRLYMPQAGQIFFKGEDITKLPLTYLRENIAVSTQESFLFHASIRENIRLASFFSTDEVVENAARNAQVEVDVSREKDYGTVLDTVLNTTVQSISNGQMQRINLARAFLKDADVLMLDEPTSALDSDTAKRVEHYIFNVLNDRTILIILHNQQNLQRFDRVLRLENGKVVSCDKIHT